jgi:NAD(P)-dependent dehydrogenase (short-subunit alcohol dehydrogenase family)
VTAAPSVAGATAASQPEAAPRRRRAGRFDGKVAIVTGASSGIGRATAVVLAAEGASVVLADIQAESRLAEEQPTTLELIGGAGGEAEFVRCDVSRPSDVAGVVERAGHAFGGLDLLVNNAGVFVRNAVTDVSDDEWEAVLGVNLRGYFLACRAAIPRMVERGAGVIVNVGSIHGMLGTEGAATYCASKGAIDNLTRQLAVDYARLGIRVNSVAPGTIETAMSKPFRDDPVLLAEYRARTLLPRLGTPADVANAILFLASEEASFITGHTLVVDGGWTAA